MIFKATLAVFLKDLRIERRTKEILVSTGLFAALVTVLSSLSFYIDPNRARLVAPGVLWTSIAFAGVLAMSRSWAREREGDTLRALLMSPIPRAAIFLGKTLSTLLFLLVVEALLLPLVGVLFHLNLVPVLGPLCVLLLLGTLAFAAMGNLFAVMSVRTRARDLMLSVVIFPLVAPALLAGVVATRELLQGADWGQTLGWVRLLAACDLAAVVGGYALFESLASE